MEYGLQVDLQYPPAKDRPAVQTVAGGGSSAADRKRPRFSAVLARSLQPQADLRAWFDEQHGYQPVQQMRLPLKLPNVRQTADACLFTLFCPAHTSAVSTVELTLAYVIGSWLRPRYTMHNPI